MGLLASGRGSRLLLGLAALLCSGWLATSASAVEINSVGPLTKIGNTPDLNCYVNHISDSVPEFYGNTACGTLLASGGTLYGPAGIPAGGSASPRTAWTAVSQEGPVGSGTAADPFRVTTVVHGGVFRVTQVDSYIVGQESYRTDVTVENTSDEAADIVLYRAGDCFLQNSDYGYGRVDGDAPTCLAAGPDGKPGTRIEQFTPITPESHFYEAVYSEVWRHIGTQQPFPDTCRCEEFIDNGAGVSWSRNLPAGREVTLSSLITFSPIGNVPLVVTKEADDDSVEAGGATGYTITVTNPNIRDIALTELNEDLPPGFSYLKGSTSGATKADPQIAGQRLTWSGLTVPRNGLIALHFAVRVAPLAGVYLDNAGGVSPGNVVVPAEGVAPVTVTAGALTERDLVLEKSPDNPAVIASTQNGYTITVANPTDRALTLSRLIEVLPADFTYIADSTTGLTTANPQIEGRRLTWQVSVSVPPFAAEQLHFRVRIPVTDGVRKNPLVDGRSPDGGVRKATESAPIAIKRPILGTLRLRKRPNRRSIVPGEKVKFTLKLVDLAPKTATRARICDHLPRGLRLVSANGAQVKGRRLCWERGLPAKVVSKRVSYVARAAPGARGRVASTAAATAEQRFGDRSRAGVSVHAGPSAPPEVTG